MRRNGKLRSNLKVVPEKKLVHILNTIDLLSQQDIKILQLLFIKYPIFRRASPPQRTIAHHSHNRTTYNPTISYPNIPFHRNKALDVFFLDHALLQLLLPRFEQMWTYGTGAILPSSWSDSLTGFDGDTNAHGTKRDLMLAVLRALMLLCTVGSGGSSTGRTPAMTVLRLSLHSNNNGSTIVMDPTLLKQVKRQGSISSCVQRDQIHRFLLASAVCPVLYQLLVWAKNHHDVVHRRFANGTTTGIERENEGGQHRSFSSSYHCKRLAIERRRMVLHRLLWWISCVMPPLELYHHLTYVMDIRRRIFDGNEDVDNLKSPSYSTLALYWSG